MNFRSSALLSSALLLGATAGSSPDWGASLNYEFPNPQRKIHRYHAQRYAGAANPSACRRRREKNKMARKSRQRNRR